MIIRSKETMDSARAKAFICDPPGHTRELGDISDDICLIHVRIKAGLTLEEDKLNKLNLKLENFFVPLMKVLQEDLKQQVFYRRLKIDYNSLETMFNLSDPSREYLIIFFNQLLIDAYALVNSTKDTIKDKQPCADLFNDIGQKTLAMQYHAAGLDKGCF